MKKLLFLFFLVPHFLFSLETQPKVVVIGAGLAGLAAAYRLQQLGYEVDVYEARRRAGGRILTLFSGDSYEELGGKNLNDGGDGRHVIALAKEMGLDIEKSVPKYTKGCIFDGKVCSYHPLLLSCPEPSEQLFSSLKERGRLSKNLGEILDHFFVGHSEIRQFVETRMRNFEGSATCDLSTFYLNSFWDFYQSGYALGLLETRGEFDSYKFDTVKGGNFRLIEALCSSLKKPVYLNAPLIGIGKENGKFRLSFRSRDDVVADLVLLALPCSTLKDVIVDSGIIPNDQWEAVQTLEYGTNAKMLLPIRLHRKEFEFAYTRRSVIWFNKDDTIMTCYYGGPAGLLTPLKEIFQEEIEDIEQLYPGSIFTQEIEFVQPSDKPYVYSSTPVAVSWAYEEFSKGSYSVFGAGKNEAIHAIQQDWEEPVRSVFRSIDGRLFFAGEHTAVDFPATMEGAVESGEKAARMMQRSLLAEFQR